MKNKNLNYYEVIVIGGGPAGIMAAIKAGSRGRSVLLIEKNSGLGKKLLISGKGRCNLTNSADMEEFLEKFSKGGKFLRNAFVQFFNADLIKFFNSSRVPLKTERGGRVFPQSDTSRDILSALETQLKKNNVTVIKKTEVKKVFPLTDSSIKVYLTDKDTITASKVIIATGGISYPGTGSTGDGFRFAGDAGHTVIKQRPALVPVEIKESFVKKWQGISLKNVTCAVYAHYVRDTRHKTQDTGKKLNASLNCKKVTERFGEMLFTHFGISGPIILDLSADIFDCLEKEKEVYLSINFKPALSREKVDKRLLREFEQSPSKTIKNIMYSLLPKGLVSEFLNYCNIPENIKANQINKDMRKSLVNGLTEFKLHPKKVRPISEAIVTRGGVKTAEINPKTMESRIAANLFFAGEIIDIDAKTGGYNMQAAFSTGWVAGNSV